PGDAHMPNDAGRWRPLVATARGLAAAHPALEAAVPTIEPHFGSDSRLRRIVGEATWLRQHAHDVELVHHGGGTAPLRAHRPYVLTIHDLQFRTYPEYFTRVKRAYLGSVIPRSVRRATVVTVPSEYVRDSVVQAYGADPDRVMVVPHGIEAGLATDATPDAELRERYQLGAGPVVVYPAVTHPHKNHAFLLELMERHWRDPHLRLVLTGGQGLADHVVAGCTDPRVRRLGRVSDADRNGLLAMATALVFPSRYEGFGAPLIEAMTMGAPVVCADVTCMPSIVGDAGLVLPLRPDAWADALHEVSRRRDELVAAGRRRALDFTAVASGRALAAAYTRALELS
ncbi:MAG TPA: hypothetical protein DCR14_16460, partial [Acidimicrobiaceae bacterium]|nr:hypothetical protein [Acidimicrobiaceae bacterium]